VSDGMANRHEWIGSIARGRGSKYSDCARQENRERPALMRIIMKSMPALIALWAPLALAYAAEDQLAGAAAEPAPAIGAKASQLPPPSLLPGEAEHEPYLIDLPTALRLANGENPQIQFARERIRAAQARFDQTHVLWLPNLLVGSDWHRHDGQI